VSEPILLAPRRRVKLPLFYRALPGITFALCLMFVAFACTVLAAVFDTEAKKAMCP
jgi:hypothetical protein